MNGKCPNAECAKVVSQVTIASVQCREVLGRVAWRGVSYACPFCNTILSVQIDPVALKTDIVKSLRGRT